MAAVTAVVIILTMMNVPFNARSSAEYAVRPRIPRDMLSGMLLGALVAGVAGYSRAVSERQWPHNDVTTLEGVNGPVPDGDSWLVMQGLGVKSGQEIAHKAAQILPSVGKAAYMSLANHGVTKLEIAERLSEYTAGVDELHVVLHSMGAVTFFEGIRELRRRGEAVPPLKTAVLICSPSGLADAKLASAARLALRSPIRTGPISKGVFSAIRWMHNEGYSWRAVPGAFADARRQASGGVSPALWKSQMRLLESSTVVQRPELFEGFVTKDTKPYFCLPEHKYSDTTVAVEDAMLNYASFFVSNDAYLEPIFLPTRGHADWQTALELTAASLRGTLKVR